MDAEIRITFEPGRDESWVGKEALNVSPAMSTMNLGSVDVVLPEQQRRAAVLHELAMLLDASMSIRPKGRGSHGTKEESMRTSGTVMAGLASRSRASFSTSTRTEWSRERNSTPNHNGLRDSPELTDGKLRVDETFDLSQDDKIFIAEVYGTPIAT